MNTRRAGALAIVVMVALVAIIIAADRGMMPEWIERFYDWPGGDKLGHLVLMGTAAFVVELALAGRSHSLRFGGRTAKLWLGSLGVGAAVIAEECSQLAFPSRTFSLADLACSLAGVLAGGALARALLARAGARARGGEAGE